MTADTRALVFSEQN